MCPSPPLFAAPRPSDLSCNNHKGQGLEAGAHYRLEGKRRQGTLHAGRAQKAVDSGHRPNALRLAALPAEGRCIRIFTNYENNSLQHQSSNL